MREAHEIKGKAVEVKAAEPKEARPGATGAPSTPAAPAANSVQPLPLAAQLPFGSARMLPISAGGHPGSTATTAPSQGQASESSIFRSVGKMDQLLLSQSEELGDKASRQTLPMQARRANGEHRALLCHGSA